MMQLQQTATSPLGARTAAAKPSPPARGVACRAVKSPLLLDQPKRLWEAGNELWFHGLEPPAYLDGSLPGDAGFDPFGLATVEAGSAALTGVAETPEKNLLWLLEGELYNGRVAMLAVVGILLQEKVFGLGPWWTLPAQADLAPAISNPTAKYIAVVVVAHLLYGQFEFARVKGFKENNATTSFDPLNLRSDYTRQAEVRNGRLAMLAVAGFATQAAVTGRTPWQNLEDHLADPTHVNALTTSKASWFIFAAVLVFGVAINLVGFGKSRPDARVRTLFNEFSS